MLIHPLMPPLPLALASTTAASTASGGGTGSTTGTAGSSWSSGSSSSSPSSSSTDALGTTDSFMKLLVTQLQNQDPMSPLQPYELAAQLAQFASVEQLNNISTQLGTQNQSTQIDTMVGQTALATGMIGRMVVADGDQLTVTSGTPTNVTITVGGTGGAATLHLTDANGKEVATRDLGDLSPGTQTVKLPSDLPAGDWHYSVSCTGADGKAQTVTTTTSGVVTGVSFTGSSVVLRVGDLQVPLDQVQDVELVSTNP